MLVPSRWNPLEPRDRIAPILLPRRCPKRPWYMVYHRAQARHSTPLLVFTVDITRPHPYRFGADLQARCARNVLHTYQAPHCLQRNLTVPTWSLHNLPTSLEPLFWSLSRLCALYGLVSPQSSTLIHYRSLGEEVANRQRFAREAGPWRQVL